MIKGCRREHALADGEPILVSPVARLRTEGENLIRDEQEGLATVETEIVESEMPVELFKHRRLADVKGAVELLDSPLKVKHRRTSAVVHRSSKRLTFGRERPSLRTP
ncbi:hypothetical protein [Candidatus Palauibacter sp.]|uniref:hypothetical protein n=1 Tax=Candidatus Palauibacter sp. TaxID=3101350 RepID=UPI003B51D6FA